MKTETHGNGNGLDDLFILPETERERALVEEYLSEHGWNASWQTGDVKGHPWFRKRFLDVPFGESLRDVLTAFVASNTEDDCERG